MGGNDKSMEGDTVVDIIDDVTVKKEKKEKEKKPSFSPKQLFSHADGIDVFLIICGTIAACAHGLVLPSFSLLIGNITDALNAPGNVFYSKVMSIVYDFIYVGLGGLAVGFVEYSCWGYTAERQASKLKEKYLKSVLRQEIGWFDQTGTGEVTSRISSDTIIVHDGLDKFGIFITNMAQFIAGFVLGFYRGWRLCLVMFAVSPVLVGAMAFMIQVETKSTLKAQNAYAKAGVIATEAISSIRTVASFNGEERIKKKYNQNLKAAMKEGIKGSGLGGLGQGVMMMVFFCFFAITLWYGSREVVNGKLTGGHVLTVMFAVMMGAGALGKIGPSMEHIGKANGAIIKLNEIIARKSKIDVTDDNGIKKNEVKGTFQFKNVKFCYPTRTEVQVMDGINLKIRHGKTTALVGPSGSGKSSIVQLVQRFYDPNEGEVTLDGTDLTKLNVKWLREQLSIVSQEPVLFSGTIAENIRYGKKGATQQEIEDACRASNAHNFIMQFPDKYNTKVGEKGAQLSGGQKQRIAIARAIIKNPKILLLDEATSALDNESEKVVQEALDSVMKGRTTIVIAHRLSTIQHADKIIVIDKGRVVEKGTHKKLMSIEGGVYANLVTLQSVGITEEQKKIMNENKEFEPTDMKVNVNSSLSSDSFEEEISLPETKKKSKEENYKVSMWRLFGYTRKDWYYYVIAAISALLSGAVMPSLSIIFARMINLYYLPVNQIKHEAAILAGSIAGLSGVPFIFQTLLTLMISIIAQHFVKKIRNLTFKSILRQNIAFFDQDKHKTGVLTTNLAGEVTIVGNMIGPNLSTGFQLVGTVLTGFAIAFYFGWKMALVLIAASPLIMFGEFMENVTTGAENQDSKKYSEPNQIAMESIGNMRTVAAFTQEVETFDKFMLKLEGPKKQVLKKALIDGICQGLGILANMSMYAVSFWYGAKLIRDGEYDFYKMMQVFFAIVFTSVGVGQTSGLIKDIGKSKGAASVIFRIIDRKPSIDNTRVDGLTPNIKGCIEFENVKFNYPERPTIKVLDKMNFKVDEGKVMALVGQSGCGKSSIVSLLERFYDPINMNDEDDSGRIKIDGIPLQEINLKHLRQQIALVGQEPVLFSGTIGENIAWGKEGSTQEEIVAAAKAANAHNFIESFPDKYNTQVGEKGAQLSGGQKQRIAIARGIIKNPKILLLDEATSALDTESEKVVQDALESVMKGRTTIIIAHRLSTIQNADVIAVVQNGKIVESGNHDELMSRGGAYSRLHKKKKN